MGGEIKLHGFGSDVHESVHGWLAQRKKTFWNKAGGGDPDPNPSPNPNPNPDSGGDVKVTRASPNERMGSSRHMLAAAPPPDLDEIVTVDGDDVHDGRLRR
jgi:mlo protein